MVGWGVTYYSGFMMAVAKRLGDLVGLVVSTSLEEVSEQRRVVVRQVVEQRRCQVDVGEVQR